MDNNNNDYTNNTPVTHPTQYSSLSNVEVQSLFTSSSWNNLSLESKVDACQEIENRLSAERNSDSRLVSATPMMGSTYGYQSGSNITLNSTLLETGCFNVTYKDMEGNIQTAVLPVDAPSWEVLSTVYHEDTHGMWEDKGIMPQTYIQHESNSLLYYLQASEKAAFLNEEKSTLAAIKAVSEHNKEVDPQALAYIEAHSNNKYQEVLKEAQQLFNDPNIEKTLNEYISNNDKGIFPKNPSDSYIKIDDIYINQNIRNYFGNQPFKENELNTSIQNKNTTTQENNANTLNNSTEVITTNATTTETQEENTSLQTTSNIENNGDTNTESNDMDNPSIENEDSVISANNDMDGSSVENDGSAISASNDMAGSSIENDGATISEGNTAGGSSVENDGSVIDSGMGTENDNDGQSSAGQGQASDDSSGQSNDDGESNDGGGQSNDGGQDMD